MKIRITLLVIVFFLFSSCGYKPSAKFSRVVLGENISTNVIISAQDPENTVLIKDALDRAIIEAFHASLTTKKLSTTHLDILLSKVIYTPLQYDKAGYIIAYRATIILDILKKSADINKKYLTKGTYDFSVVANAVMTDKERFDAIRYGSIKAIKSFIAQVSAEGAINKKEE